MLTERAASRDILEACRLGDREALCVLYEIYKDKVYSIVLYYFHGDSAMASDITQQVFLKVMTSMAQFRGDAEFSTWLYRVVTNACRDGGRKASRREVGGEDLSRVAVPGSQEGDVVRAETEARVRAAVSSLPEKLRMPVLLRYFEELSYEELATVLECSAGTVASRLNRGHQLLREKLRAR
ncbi:MAG: sigma-70 family RNA polymerase sigma factor [Acidobacteriota bacterium]